VAGGTGEEEPRQRLREPAAVVRVGDEGAPGPRDALAEAERLGRQPRQDLDDELVREREDGRPVAPAFLHPEQQGAAETCGGAWLGFWVGGGGGCGGAGAGDWIHCNGYFSLGVRDSSKAHCSAPVFAAPLHELHHGTALRWSLWSRRYCLARSSAPA